MLIEDYYNHNFCNDLNEFINLNNKKFNLKEGVCFHGLYGLECIQESNRSYFIICLFITVYVDQAMYTYFGYYYDKFESLTKYPKYHGGPSSMNINPIVLFSENHIEVPIDSNEIISYMKEGMKLFISEVKAFFNDYIPEIDYIDFFNQIIPSYNNVDTSILNWNLVYFEIQNALNEENG